MFLLHKHIMPMVVTIFKPLPQFHQTMWLYHREKARKKVARIHARIADRRRDFLHKLSTRPIRENQTICVETLEVKHMIKNHRFASAL